MRNWRVDLIGGLHDYEVLTATGAIAATKTVTLIAPAAAAFVPASAILGDGQAGQIKYIGIASLDYAVEIEITNHEDGSAQEFTFAAVGDYLVLRFTGKVWEEIEKTSGVTNTT